MPARFTQYAPLLLLVLLAATAGTTAAAGRTATATETTTTTSGTSFSHFELCFGGSGLGLSSVSRDAEANKASDDEHEREHNREDGSHWDFWTEAALADCSRPGRLASGIIPGDMSSFKRMIHVAPRSSGLRICRRLAEPAPLSAERARVLCVDFSWCRSA
jgi:hypothetical protein